MTGFRHPRYSGRASSDISVQWVQRRIFCRPPGHQQSWLLLLAPELMARLSRLRWEDAMRKPALLQREILPEALDWSLRGLCWCRLFFTQCWESYYG